MDEITMGATGEVAQSQIDATPETNNTPADGGSEPINSQSNEKPVQDKETNSAFAEMRRARETAEKQASQAQKDLGIARKYGSEYGIYSESDIANTYGASHGITTFEQFEQALKSQQEAERMNVDPELYRKLTQTEQQAQQALEKLSKYEQKELLQKQTEELSKDSRWGSFFNANKSEILDVASKFNVDLNTARLLVLDQKYQEPDLEQVRQNAVKEYFEKVKAGNTPVEGSGNSAIVTGNSTPKTWDDARKQALSFLRGSKQNK